MREARFEALSKACLRLSAGGDCVGKGYAGHHKLLLQALRQKQVSRVSILVTRTRCIGGCGLGPNIAIYPKGVGYCRVQPEDIQEIVEEHLLGDRIVSRLLSSTPASMRPDL